MSSSAITGPIFTDVRRSPSGSAAAPSWSFNDSQGTGFYLVSANVLGLSTAGVQRVVVDASGNVGIGTASPSQKLTVAGGIASSTGISALAPSTAFFDNNGGIARFAGVGSTTGTAATITLSQYSSNGSVGRDAVTIDASGNLLVGTTSTAGFWDGTPGGNARFAYDGQATTTVESKNGQNSRLILSSRTSNSTDLWYDITLSKTNDRLLIGGAKQGLGYIPGTFMVTNGAWFQGNNSASWSTTSDIRIKENIRPVNACLEKVVSLNPVHFEYVNSLGKIKTGFIAQEFEQVLPGHVCEILCPEEIAELKPELKDKNIKGIDTDLIPYLVGAIKEQQEIIEKLEARLAALESK